MRLVMRSASILGEGMARASVGFENLGAVIKTDDRRHGILVDHRIDEIQTAGLKPAIDRLRQLRRIADPLAGTIQASRQRRMVDVRQIALPIVAEQLVLEMPLEAQRCIVEHDDDNRDVAARCRLQFRHDIAEGPISGHADHFGRRRRKLGSECCRNRPADTTGSPWRQDVRPGRDIIDMAEGPAGYVARIVDQNGVFIHSFRHFRQNAFGTRRRLVREGNLAEFAAPLLLVGRVAFAGFIGNVNMFEGVVTVDQPDHVRIRSKQVGGDIFVPHGVSCAPDQTLWYALRPEKLRVGRDKPEGDANFAHGTVDEIVYLGDLSLYHIVLDSGQRIQATKPNIERTDEENITWDEKVYVSWDGHSGVVLTS